MPPGSPGSRGRRTALVLGVVAAVVVVAAAFVVTFVVTRGDDAPEQADTSAPPTETSVAPAQGDPVTGDGYTYRLPATGWQEASQEAKVLADTIDTAIILGSSIDLSQSSVIVEALDAGPATSVDDLAGLWKRNLAGVDGATPVDIDETTIDGERAIGVRIEDRVNEAGDPITQVAYLALHGGKQYSVGLSFPRSGDTTSEGDFAALLASWTWES